MKKMRKNKPKIQSLFAPYKQELKNITYEEWEALSEPGNHAHTKKAKIDRFTPAPKSLLEQARAESNINTQLDFNTLPTPGYATGFTSGFATPGFQTSLGSMTPGNTSVYDMTKVGHARQTIMQAKLAAASDSVTGQSTVNKDGYLTDLDSLRKPTTAEVGDMNKARALLDSVCKSNPNQAAGWIARARLEETAGKLVAARKIIVQGYKNCPKSQDVWLEAARLHDLEESKNILSHATRQIPQSVPIWLAAANLENDVTRKKRVLKKALEINPNSPKLWRSMVELEDPAAACLMLSHAVECIPTSVEMWLALAKLETYENAKKVLNKARKTIPTEKSIWITAAELEEANGNVPAVGLIISKAVQSLAAHGVQIDRDQWIKEAEQCEKNNQLVTCETIIKETIGIDIDEEDKKSTWCTDAENALSRGSIHVGRAIYTHATDVYPSKKSLWLKMANLEKRYGDPNSLEGVLSRAVRYCRQSDVLWLMYAKHKWVQSDVDGARRILNEAFSSLPGNEQIWLAAVKLEKENGEFELARGVLERARANAGTERVWMKSALLERDLGHTEAERSLLQTAVTKYPKFDKLYLMLGQLEERARDYKKAQDTFLEGVKHCNSSIPLWISLARVEERLTSISRARAILEKAMLKNPMNPLLWLESIRSETRTGDKRSAFNMLAKGLQECPKSGILWAEAIEMETVQAKKARSVDALKRCDQDPIVILAVAKLFWENRQLDKARVWFKRCITLDPNYGDSWAFAYKFELQNGNDEQQRILLEKCVAAEPHKGERWIAVSKDIKYNRYKSDQILVEVASRINIDM
jgi:pre-mRNA-processing factor 6